MMPGPGHSDRRSLGQLPQSCARPAVPGEAPVPKISKTEGLEEEVVWGGKLPLQGIFSCDRGGKESPQVGQPAQCSAVLSKSWRAGGTMTR